MDLPGPQVRPVKRVPPEPALLVQPDQAEPMESLALPALLVRMASMAELPDPLALMVLPAPAGRMELPDPRELTASLGLPAQQARAEQMELMGLQEKTVLQ